MMPSDRPLPAGSLGLPVLGHMLAFAKNPFQFIEDGIADHGPVFKARLLLRKAVVMAGPEACEKFVNPDLIQRAGAFPKFVERLFGGKSLPFLDGDIHLARKQIILQAFSPSALQSYVPTMQRIVEASFLSWSTLGEFSWMDRLRRLAFEVICANMLSLGPGPKLKQLQSDYEDVSNGLVALPIRIPGTAYWRALRGRKRIFATLRPILQQRQESPTSDGVSRILGATSSDGTKLTIDEAVLETHHAIIAGFIVFAEMASAILFSNVPNPARTALIDEVKSVVRGSSLTVEELGKLRHTGEFVMEVKRLAPIIPAVFGKARKDFEIHGVRVPAGWLVLWAVRSTNIFRDSFVDRMQFNPGRFAVPPTNPFVFVPQGGGVPTGHRCAGLDYSGLLLQIFTIVLLRDYAVRLSDPDPIYNWKLNPPQPLHGLQATVSPIASAAEAPVRASAARSPA